MKRILSCGACAVLMASMAGAPDARAQSYPTKPIRWVLGFPGGGTSDILARGVGAKLTESLGQQVVIDNRPGASGIIANETVARAAPDGYTLLMVSSTYANLKSLKDKLPYDPDRDLVPVAGLAWTPNVLATHPSVPVKSVKDLVALAQGKPGQINYGTGGTGTGPHLATELFELMTGVKLTHVPYKGTPPAVNDLLAGRVQMMMALSPVAMPHVKAGKLRPLAVSGAKRIGELPDVPTVAETVPGYEATTWYGVLVPRGTPQRTIDLLNREIVKALGDKLVTERLAALGFETDTRSPQEFGRFMQNETEKWAKVIARAGIPKS